MQVQLAASQWRIVPAVLGSTVAFLALAFLMYWLYFTYFVDVYERFPTGQNRPPEGLVSLQLLFYVAFTAHLMGSIGAALAVTFWTKAPKDITYAIVAVIFAILMVLVVYLSSVANACAVYVSFPIPGFVCDD